MKLQDRRAGVTWDLACITSAPARLSGQQAIEVILVMVEGKAHLNAAGQDWGLLGERRTCLSGLPHCLYVPNGTPGRPRRRTAFWQSALRLVLAGTLPQIGPDTITLTQRSMSARFINNIAMEGEDYADSLLVTSIYASRQLVIYPSRHDEDDFPRITYLEEAYYATNPADGFGFQGCTPMTAFWMKPWLCPTATLSLSPRTPSLWRTARL